MVVVESILYIGMSDGVGFAMEIISAVPSSSIKEIPNDWATLLVAVMGEEPIKSVVLGTASVEPRTRCSPPVAPVVLGFESGHSDSKGCMFCSDGRLPRIDGVDNLFFSSCGNW